MTHLRSRQAAKPNTSRSLTSSSQPSVLPAARPSLIPRSADAQETVESARECSGSFNRVWSRREGTGGAGWRTGDEMKQGGRAPPLVSRVRSDPVDAPKTIESARERSGSFNRVWSKREGAGGAGWRTGDEMRQGGRAPPLVSRLRSDPSPSGTLHVGAPVVGGLLRKATRPLRQLPARHEAQPPRENASLR